MIWFLLSLGAYLAVIVWFLVCAEQDARSWVTAWDQFCHPYRRLTQLLLIPVLLGWLLPLWLWELV